MAQGQAIHIHAAEDGSDGDDFQPHWFALSYVHQVNITLETYPHVSRTLRDHEMSLSR